MQNTTSNYRLATYTYNTKKFTQSFVYVFEPLSEMQVLAVPCFFPGSSMLYPRSNKSLSCFLSSHFFSSSSKRAPSPLPKKTIVTVRHTGIFFPAFDIFSATENGDAPPRIKPRKGCQSLVRFGPGEFSLVESN